MLEAKITFGNTIEPRMARWLIPNLIPLGCITIIDGDPGQGKSFLTLEFAARVTRGQEMTANGFHPNPTQTPANVVILNAEDMWAETIIPRLRGIGADMARIIRIDRIKRDGEEQEPAEPADPVPIMFPHAASVLRGVVENNRVKLVIIDPLMGYLDPDVNTFSDQNVRLALRPLQIMAEASGCAVLLVRHLNKGNSKNLLYRGGGSIGLIGLARAGFYVGPDPEDRTRRVFAQTKNNLGPKSPPWLFSMQEAQDGTRQLRWHGVSDVPTALLTHEEAQKMPREKAADFLAAQFTGKSQLPYQEILACAQAQGISEGTLKRAYKDMALKAKKVGAEWFWVNPANMSAIEQVQSEYSLTEEE